ncbi:MAG: GNAT family N-acetyltransferase [Tannerella sp.]|jgi:RimJ/RimL family protein N-acetyltransferase|nr:GNAT family N-acetyltransferase [Tannerella sp.]
MELETERLFIKLLTLSQLKLWVNNIPLLESELNCKYDAEPIEGKFLDIINAQIEIIENDPLNYMYHSFWFIIRKSDGIVAGSMDFKNIPNQMKEIEIGYGLGKKYEHNGYMTEAVEKFCEWALTDEHIETVIAETETDNIASKRVLERCGFKKYKEEETVWWKLNRTVKE